MALLDENAQLLARISFRLRADNSMNRAEDRLLEGSKRQYLDSDKNLHIRSMTRGRDKATSSTREQEPYETAADPVNAPVALDM